MKHLVEYRSLALVNQLVKAITALTTRPWRIMEVCGGQTHSIIKHGLDQLLPEGITLIHGPGCPVCVTPLAAIDQALAIAIQPDVVFCSFGDMLRVPGSSTDLLSLKAQGADVRVVYSPLDALNLARQLPDKQVVFFAVGFETTAPATALAAYQAKQAQINNFSLLVCHVRVPPVLQALLAAPSQTVQGFLGAGHVSAVMGYHEYLAISAEHRVPIVITGFEPVDILQGVYRCIQQLESGQHTVTNQYRRVVTLAGNPSAQQWLGEVFAVVDSEWRGLGNIPLGGLTLKPGYATWDASLRYSVTVSPVPAPGACRSGEVLQGLLSPPQCPEFGKTCTPEQPLGATMVSSEGACAAYFRYRRLGR